MQLRKVCNHPNLFEVRPTISPFQMDGINYRTASLVCNMLDYNPFTDIDLNAINLLLINIELCMTAYVAHRIKKLATPKKLIEEIDTVPELPPQCPSGKLKLHVRVKDSRVQDSMLSHSSGVKVGTSPAMKTEGTKLVPVCQSNNNINEMTNNKKLIETQAIIPPLPLLPPPASTSSNNTTTQIITSSATPQTFNLRKRSDMGGVMGSNVMTTQGGNRINVGTSHLAKIVQTSSGQHILLTTTNSGTGKDIFLILN